MLQAPGLGMTPEMRQSVEKSVTPVEPAPPAPETLVMPPGSIKDIPEGKGTPPVEAEEVPVRVSSTKAEVKASPAPPKPARIDPGIIEVEPPDVAAADTLSSIVGTESDREELN